MPNDARTPIQTAWLKFAMSVQSLLVPQVDDRPLDQYLAIRDAVLVLVQSNQFLAELNKGWSETLSATPEIKTALLLELEAFPRAVEVAQTIAKPEETKGWWRNMLGRASTVSGSVKDIVENLPPYARHGLVLFKELIDLFKGKD